MMKAISTKIIEYNLTILNENDTLEEEHYIFDNNHVKTIFFCLYSIVFCSCFFGNSLVILVIILNRRLRSATNFFLANLAFADFCVGVFCIYQNFFVYIIKSWSLGEFLCKMYLFIQTLSNTASILILVGICVERYFAIIYPIISKRILTPRRIKIKILIIWIISIGYSFPRFVFGKTITNIFSNGNGNETICIMNREKYNSELADLLHFMLLYCLPMLIITSLYTKIALCLWRSSEQVKKQLDASSCDQLKRQKNGNEQRKLTMDTQHRNGGPFTSQTSNNSSNNVLRARRGVIKMLIVVVLSFALCHFPFHFRKIWQYYTPHYQAGTDLSAVLTPLTYLTTYLNSAVNPLLYAFLSNNFRREMRSIIICFLCQRKRKQTQDIHLQLKRQQSSSNTFRSNTTILASSNIDDIQMEQGT